jgi:hypothetical protein
MTTELWLAALIAVAFTGPMLLLGMRARRQRPQPVRVHSRPVNRPLDR